MGKGDRHLASSEVEWAKGDRHLASSEPVPFAESVPFAELDGAEGVLASSTEGLFHFEHHEGHVVVRFGVASFDYLLVEPIAEAE